MCDKMVGNMYFSRPLHGTGKTTQQYSKSGQGKIRSRVPMFRLRLWLYHLDNIRIYLHPFIYRTLKPSPSSERARGLMGSTHLSLVHVLHLGLAGCGSSPAPRQLFLASCDLLVVCSRTNDFDDENQIVQEKKKGIVVRTHVLSNLMVIVGTLYHRGAVANNGN